MGSKNECELRMKSSQMVDDQKLHELERKLMFEVVREQSRRKSGVRSIADCLDLVVDILHRLEDRIEAREGDLFAPVAGETFDLILFNPPFFRGEPRSRLCSTTQEPAST